MRSEKDKADLLENTSLVHDDSPGLTQKIQKTVRLLKALVPMRIVVFSARVQSSPSSDQSVIDADVNQEPIMQLEDMQFKSGNLID